MGSRVAASLTAAMGCGDTIARNEDDYAEIAVAFGRCPLLWSSLLSRLGFGAPLLVCFGARSGVPKMVRVLLAGSRRSSAILLTCYPLFRRNARALQRAKACVRKGKVDAPLFDTARWVWDQERALAMASGTCAPRQTCRIDGHTAAGRRPSALEASIERHRPHAHRRPQI